MAKKSTKSTRRSRAKKVQPTKRSVQARKPASSGDGDASAPESARAERQNKELGLAPEAEARPAPPAEPAEVTEHRLTPPTRGMRWRWRRRRAVMSAVSLLAIVVLAWIVLLRPHDQTAETTSSEHASQSADEILQSGGKMCTNQQATSGIGGSTNPQSAGMILQSNPASTIQTPQPLASTNDAAALQGAACF